MNPNDYVAQQQAILNQAMQTQQHWVWGMIAIELAFLLIGAWVIYMFYARLRDLADELMKFRIAYEMSEGRKDEAAKRTPPPADANSRYAPKS
jgi:hypothetical protein